MTTTYPGTEQKTHRILIADDHAIVRIGIRILIKNMDSNALVEEAVNGESVIRKLKTDDYDLLILDISMPRTESFSLTNYILKEFPSLKVLIFTINQEAFFAKRFLKLGVHGYMIKESKETEVQEAIRTILNGQIYVSDALSGILSDEVMGTHEENPFEKLSDREFELILQILKGYPVAEIADTLHLNKSTIGTHKSRIMKKLKLSNTIELMNLAKAHNIIA